MCETKLKSYLFHCIILIIIFKSSFRFSKPLLLCFEAEMTSYQVDSFPGKNKKAYGNKVMFNASCTVFMLHLTITVNVVAE